MPDSAVTVFERLVESGPPTERRVLVDTACVLGGSIAGLLAATVLSGSAREVVIVERDDVSAVGTRPGTPQDQQVHALLPAGRFWIERWLPGFTRHALDLGAVPITPGQTLYALDGYPMKDGWDDRHGQLGATRPFLEARVRERVLALPNVRVLRARATGLEFTGGAVSGVRYDRDGVSGRLDAGFAVDAMGRSSRLPEWLAEAGFDRPVQERLKAPINYATALFERKTPVADLVTATALTIYSEGPGDTGVALAAASAVEDDQWLVLLMGYDEVRPGRTIGEFRAICAELTGVFGEATSGPLTRDIVTYHQRESRRRDYGGLSSFPARLVGVGDAVASFNPMYGQGMSSAALQAACLASYLADDPDLTTPAAEFFALQRVVVDAAWSVSAGGDVARLDAAAGIEPPEEVRRRRWELERIMAGTLADETVARVFKQVAFMLRHPAALGDPALIDRAVAATG